MPEVNGSVDASALKALSHPLRTAMLSRLMDHGSATATQLAKELGESTGQTSYHLRQLERHGLVEDDPERAGGRERWWRPVAFRTEVSELRQDPDGRAGLESARQWALADRVQAITRWGQEAFDDQEWSDASTMLSSGGRFTPAEAEALAEELESVVRAHVERAHHAEQSDQDPARRRIRIYVDVMPVATEP